MPIFFKSASRLGALRFFQAHRVLESTPAASVHHISKLAFLNTRAVEYKHQQDLAAALGKLGLGAGTPPTDQSITKTLALLKTAYPGPNHPARPGRLKPDEAVELAYWMLSGLNAEILRDEERPRVLSAIFYLTKGITPPAYLSSLFKNWLNTTLSNIDLSNPPSGLQRLETWNDLIRKASLAAYEMRLEVPVPLLRVRSTAAGPQLGRFELHCVTPNAGVISINEDLLKDDYRQLSKTAGFALGVACIVHEMTHAVQHALLRAPTVDTPFPRVLALSCHLEGELPALHWLLEFSDLPEHLSPGCMLPHELQAWCHTQQALRVLGQHNQGQIKHIEQALLYISPTLKKMGFTDGQSTQHNHNPHG